MTDFSYKPTLTGDLVVLRPLDEGDYDAIRAAVDDPDVVRLTGSHGVVDEQKAREWMRTRKDQPDRREWVDSIVMSVLAQDWRTG